MMGAVRAPKPFSCTCWAGWSAMGTSSSIPSANRVIRLLLLKTNGGVLPATMEPNVRHPPEVQAMNRTIKSTLVLFCTPLIWCQTTVTNSDTVPIYRVTVVERTVDAINYQYRSGPTRLDFRGTVLLPEGKGEATVESKTGR